MKSVNAHKLTDEDNPSSFSCILEKCCDNHTKIEEEVVPLEENITEIDEILINANNSGNSSNGKDFLNGSEKMHEDNPSPNSTEPMECGSIASERITTKCSSDDVVMSESTEVSFFEHFFGQFFYCSCFSLVLQAVCKLKLLIRL